MSLSISTNGNASITVSVEVNGTIYSGMSGLDQKRTFQQCDDKISKCVDPFVVTSPVFLQEPCLPTSLVGPRGPLCRLPLPQLPPLEPAPVLASLHPRLRPSAPRPPPPQRAQARPSRPPAGLPNSSCPLYVLPRPLFHRETPHEYTVQ